jgi:hypothetical protein
VQIDVCSKIVNKGECEGAQHPECAWVMASITEANKQCQDTPLFKVALGAITHLANHCNAFCIDLKDCVNFSVYNNECYFWKGAC